MAGQQPAATAPPAQQPAATAPPAQPQGQGEAMPKAVDDRFKAIETTQQQQGSLLEKIAAAVVPGDGGGQPPAAGPAAPDGRSLAQQVREEIDAANERRAAEEGEKTWRDGVNQVVEKVRAESAPREPEKGFRARAQRALFGKPDA